MQTVLEYCTENKDIFDFDKNEITEEELEDFIFQFIVKYFEESIHARNLIDVNKISWKNKILRNKIENIYKMFRKYNSKSYTNENLNKLKFQKFISTFS